MSDKPVVGLTARTLPLQAARKMRPTETVARSYIEPLEAEGALVLLLPNGEPERAEDYLALLDGLLLTGGDDPHAHLFGEEPHPSIEMVDGRRDRFEIALVRAARASGIPVLGLCRGIQLMNIALGGDIYQDIGDQTGSQVRHSQTRVDDGPWHKITVEPESVLGGILGGGERTVNSFHHQACRRLGEGLVASAKSPQDGLIEAMEDPSEAFFVGVQWHPELSPEADGPLFRAFVEAASRKRAAASK
ncbi:MAG: gamma-glutamyl-gamma-aminobutyrate hydrolase family protein [Planctomycetota bacterium]